MIRRLLVITALLLIGAALLVLHYGVFTVPYFGWVISTGALMVFAALALMITLAISLLHMC
jgi:hypothetical protein